MPNLVVYAPRFSTFHLHLVYICAIRLLSVSGFPFPVLNVNLSFNFFSVEYGGVEVIFGSVCNSTLFRDRFKIWVRRKSIKTRTGSINESENTGLDQKKGSIKSTKKEIGMKLKRGENQNAIIMIQIEKKGNWKKNITHRVSQVGEQPKSHYNTVQLRWFFTDPPKPVGHKIE